MDDWRVVVEVETDSPDGRHALRLDIPRDRWTLPDLHELARTAAEAASVLTEESTAVCVRVSFPADPDGRDAGLRALEAVLRARLEAWYRRSRVAIRPTSPPR
jgi:hypothetical protein